MIITIVSIGAHTRLDRRLHVGRQTFPLSPDATGYGPSSLRLVLPPVASAAVFPVLSNLSTFPGAGLSLARLLDPTQQRRRFLLLIDRRHRRIQILKHRTPLLGAGRYHRPDPGAPASSRFPIRPLRYMAINHDKADRLLRQIVGRFHPRRRHKREISSPMGRETLAQ